MTENVHEKLAVITKPITDPGVELPVVTHVLEHFDRDNAIEMSAGVEVIHVRGDHRDVVETECGCPGFNEITLAAGV